MNLLYTVNDTYTRGIGLFLIHLFPLVTTGLEAKQGLLEPRPFEVADCPLTPN